VRNRGTPRVVDHEIMREHRESTERAQREHRAQSRERESGGGRTRKQHTAYRSCSLRDCARCSRSHWAVTSRSLAACNLCCSDCAACWSVRVRSSSKSGRLTGGWSRGRRSRRRVEKVWQNRNHFTIRITLCVCVCVCVCVREGEIGFL
jgi:hypothetical protein